MEMGNRNNDKAINRMLVRTMRIADLRVEQRDDGTLSRRIIGRAVPFDEWSKPFWEEWVEKIDSRAFDGCDMSDVIMCTDHGTKCADVLARMRNGEGTLSIHIESDGLRFAFDAPHTTRGNDLLELVSRGDIGECSFKFIVAEDRWTWRSAANGLKYDQRVVTKIARLFDLSIVVSGAYPSTSAVTERASADERAAVEALRREAARRSEGAMELVRERVALYARIANH